MPSNLPPGRGNPAMQGLAGAAPPPDAGGQQPDPQQLLQIAATLLDELSQKFGPEILDVLKQILSQQGGGAVGGQPAAGQPPKPPQPPQPPSA